MNHETWEKLTMDRSVFRNKYLFDRTRSCLLHLPNEQPDSQALLRLFFHSFPSWKKSYLSTRRKPAFLELYYYNDLEAIIGKNYRHFDFRISFTINESDKKKIFMYTGITINDFVGWLCVLPFRLLVRLIQPMIIRNMKIGSVADLA